MAQPTLQAMDDKTFLAKLDVLLETLERQTEGDPLGDWTVQSVKEEVRRRLLGRQRVAKDMSPLIVGVTELTITRLIPLHSHAADFHGTPSLITVIGDSTAVSHGFFSRDEARAFLLGLKTAQACGLPFRSIPEMEEAQEKNHPE